MTLAMYFHKSYKALCSVVLVLGFLVPLLIYISRTPIKSELTLSSSPPSRGLESACDIPVVIILCDETDKGRKNGSSPLVSEDFGRQINQTLVLLKSLLITLRFSDKGLSPTPKNCVRVIFVSEQRKHFESIKQRIFETENWDSEFTQYFKLSFGEAKYPPGTEWMRTLFRPCATLRLFLPDLLPTYNSLIYVDTDFIFFRSIAELWSEFQSFSGTKKLGGLAPCLFHYGTRRNTVPFYGKSGLNAGLMLMNGGRMRETQWTHKIQILTSTYQTQIRLADQDILNIYFHFHPEELHLLSCTWNFRPFQCRVGSWCEDPHLLSQGISALHGNALSFTKEGTEPLFQALFRVFQTTQLHSGFSLRTFIESIEGALVVAEETAPASDCATYGGLNLLLLNGLQRLLPQV